MKIKGKVHKFGDNINTDEIIPARYLYTIDPGELAEHCMEDADPRFASRVNEGDIIVAGENFGCGSSREHAPISIKGAGVSCVIAGSFARIFYRNAINTGLPIFTSPEAVKNLKKGDTAVVNITKGEISKSGRKTVYKAEVFPGFIKEIIKGGGLMAYAAKMEQGKASQSRKTAGAGKSKKTKGGKAAVKKKKAGKKGKK